ncbi:MAG: septation ring formation regulator EzrA [Bacilli bacterium]|nr:septation ring formation regulator EzrA [Bacilli bacterium]
MRPTFLLSPLQTGLIIGVAVVLAIGIYLLLHFTLLSSIRYKKSVRELSRRFEYLHALLTGQDSQYLHRIETISLTNLLYADKFATLTKRFKDIRDKSDATAQAAINNLKDLLSERSYKALKAELPRTRAIIDNYDEEVNALNNDFLVLIKPEEECRQLSLRLKEELRKIKQSYFVKQADLSLVASSFETVFQNLDDKFLEFERLVEKAHYEEAKQLLPEISGVIKELARCLQELPNICVTITSIIPDKLASLQDRYEEMVRADFPLHHLIVKGNIEDMNNMLAEITARVTNFDLRRVNEELDAIIARIDEYFDLFDKEKEARLVFENECDAIYLEESSIEKKYIRLSNGLPDVKAIYVISAKAQSQIDGIKNLINKAGATKRSLDTLIHSGTKQPYSLLVERMHVLRDEAEQASSAIDEFERYLFSLKTDAETALATVEEYSGKLHLCEVALDKIGLDCVKEKYEATIDECYGYIDQIFGLVHTLPIDIDAVNEVVSRLNEVGNACSSAIMGDYEQCMLADSAIVYANRDRRHLGEVNDALKQTESYYFSGDFHRAYSETSACLKRLRGD